MERNEKGAQAVRILDLFSGIGGFSLGLERTGGFRTVAFCEIDPYCRAVLTKHWPGIPIHGDIREFQGISAEVICGGFPCTDISSAGGKVGIGGERSGLWKEQARIIGRVRPKYVIVENVSALLARGLGNVLGDLAALGYDAEWHCISAASIGAPHGRDRIWIIGYPNEGGQSGYPVNAEASRMPPHVADAKCGLGPLGRYLAGDGWQQELVAGNPWGSAPEDQPDFLGVDDGLPSRMDRLRSIGNSIVPQIAEMIGHAILAADR
jgi:DNA (cytosine-5)-methyltransferase 1